MAADASSDGALEWNFVYVKTKKKKKNEEKKRMKYVFLFFFSEAVILCLSSYRYNNHQIKELSCTHFYCNPNPWALCTANDNRSLTFSLLAYSGNNSVLKHV